MTAEARVVVEQGAELRDLPVEVERPTACLEHGALIGREVGRRVREGLDRAIVDGRVAALTVIYLGVAVVTAGGKRAQGDGEAFHQAQGYRLGDRDTSEERFRGCVRSRHPIGTYFQAITVRYPMRSPASS